MATRTGETDRPLDDLGHVRRIAVGIDFTDASNDALAVATGLARSTRARLSLLHVVPDPCDQPWAVADELGAALGDLTEAWVREAEARSRHLDTGLDC